MKSYIILGYAESKDVYFGEIELPLKMAFSVTDVRIYKEHSGNVPKTTIRHLQKKALKYTRKYGVTKFKVYRIGSKDCPIKVDYKTWSKSNDRNTKFIRRDGKDNVVC